MTYTAYNDAESCAVFRRFEQRLAPLLAEVAPDWLLHHMTLMRDTDHKDMTEQVVIRLVIKPIGSVRVVDDGVRRLALEEVRRG